MREFTAGLAGYEAEMTVSERVALAQVAAEVVMLLESATVSDGSGPAHADQLPMFSEERIDPPRDPAILRLLPDAAPDDPDVAAEFRRLTQPELVDVKHARLTTLVDHLLRDTGYLEGRELTERDADRSFELVVDREGAADFAAALTDIRLTLSQRLGLEADADVERLHDDVVGGWTGAQVLDDDAQYLGSVFLLAGYLQESLVSAMLTELRDSRG